MFILRNFLLFLSLVSISSNVAMASETAQGNGEGSRRNQEITRFIVPRLVPDETTDYVVVQQNSRISDSEGVPSAWLANPPADIAKEIAIWSPHDVEESPNVDPLLSEGFTPPSNAIRYQMTSSVRYRGGGHTVFVTTASPIIPPGINLNLTHSNNRARLTDGTPITVMVSCDSSATEKIAIANGYGCIQGSGTPNQVAFQRRGLIITIASNLPVERVIEIARNIVIE